MLFDDDLVRVERDQSSYIFSKVDRLIITPGEIRYDLIIRLERVIARVTFERTNVLYSPGVQAPPPSLAWVSKLLGRIGSFPIPTVWSRARILPTLFRLAGE